MPSTLGNETITIIEHISAHQYHLELEAGGTIVAGDLVKLQAADADVLPLANSDDAHLCIGVAVMDAADTELCTIAMRGYAVVKGESEAATCVAGPVEAGPFNSTTGRREYLASSAVAKTVGHNILPAIADGGDVRVVVL